jgi:hypothetical protein
MSVHVPDMTLDFFLLFTFFQWLPATPYLAGALWKVSSAPTLPYASEQP